MADDLHEGLRAQSATLTRKLPLCILCLLLHQPSAGSLPRGGIGSRRGRGTRVRGGPPSGKWHGGRSDVAHECVHVCVEEVADARNDMPMCEKAIQTPSGSICELANAAQVRQIASRTGGPSAKIVRALVLPEVWVGALWEFIAF